MIAFKLCRLKKNGEITPLFINKNQILPLNVWLDCENHPTKGFKERPFWHCTQKPLAPHLSKKNRAWAMIEMKDFTEFNRPLNQGGKWFLAKKIKILTVFKYLY
jgi:hypothetical protein